MVRQLEASLGDVVVHARREADDGETAVVEFDFSAVREATPVKGVARSYWTRHGMTVLWLVGDETSVVDPQSAYAAAAQRADRLIRENPTVPSNQLFDFAGWENTGRGDSRVESLGAALLLWAQPGEIVVVYARMQTAEQYAALVRRSALEAFEDPAVWDDLQRRLRAK